VVVSFVSVDCIIFIFTVEIICSISTPDLIASLSAKNFIMEEGTSKQIVTSISRNIFVATIIGYGDLDASDLGEGLRDIGFVRDDFVIAVVAGSLRAGAVVGPFNEALSFQIGDHSTSFTVTRLIQMPLA